MVNVAPLGGATLSPVSTSLSYAAQLQEYAAGFDGTLGSAYGPEFLSYAGSHPLLSAKQAATAFADGVASGDVAVTIASGVGATAQGVNIAAASTVEGLDQTSADLAKANPLSGLDAIGNFFNLLTDRQTLMRLAEGAIGIMLIVVAIAKLADGTQTGKVAAKVATKVGIAG